VNYTGEQLISRYNRGPSPKDTREFDRIGQEYCGYIIPGWVSDNIGRRPRPSQARSS